jgi:hypothetical protein
LTGWEATPIVWRVPDLEAPFRRQEHVVAQTMGDDLLLVPTAGGVADLRGIYVVNGTGAWVWQQLQTSKTVSALALQMCEEFEVGKEEAKRDVGDLLELLRQQGLVTREDSPGR